MKNTSKILIVDDEPGARDTLEALLSPEGYHITFACNGKEGLEKAAELTPSLLLLDVMMPEMDGFEVCRRIRANPVLAQVPIIMITALDDRDSRLEGIEAGADDFLSKPFDFNELRARVRTILRLDRYRRLLEERIKFEWVVQNANDGYLMLNMHDHVVYANSIARLYLGLSGEDDLKSDPSQETFLPLLQRQYRLEPQEAWATWPTPPKEALTRYLVRPETPISEAFWIQVESLDLPAEADANRVLRLRDVTTEVLARRNRRGFHTMICHKLRTPLVGLLGSLGFMTQHATTLSTEEITEFSEMALKSVQRLHGEIEDILQYLNTSGIGRADDSLPVGLLSSIVAQIGVNLKLNPVTVQIPDELVSAQIPLSRQAMELILWEVLENAQKFHPKQTPTIEVTLTRASDAPMVSLKIQDDGLSLSPDQLSQMWMPYYQGEKYSTGEVKGMGLGLSTVASLVWEIGGTCHAYNRKVGPGIIIDLVLPILSETKEGEE